MPERLEAARFMRESAARLRNVATQFETKLSAELIEIAEAAEAEAAKIEKAFRENPPKPSRDEDAA